MADIKKRKHNIPNAGLMGKLLEVYAKSYKDTYAPGEFGKEYGIDSKCTRCGICANVCPSGNISVEQSVSFDNRCEGCMACIHACPQNAIHLSGEKSQSRYRNKNIALHEIIVANRQQ